MANYRLPQFIVITSNEDPKMYASYKKGDDVLRSIQLKEASIFSDTVKIEVQQSTINPKYVNLLFPASKKYWHEAGNGTISAVSDKPQEDTSNPLCTLFEVTKDGDGDADGTFNFYLTHVQSGARLTIDPALAVLKIDQPAGSLLRFKDWSRLAKLPEHVAFKGAETNGKFIQVHFQDNRNYLGFKGNNPYSGRWNPNHDPYVYDVATGNKLTLLPDGHIRIKSDFNGKLWRRAPDDYILADGDPVSPPSESDLLFWPVRIDHQTIALRSAGNSNYCKRLSLAGQESGFLSAKVSSIAGEAKLYVKELVSKRKIYNVRYRMEEARIYGETSFVGGTTLVTNTDDKEAVMEVVKFDYRVEESYSFNKRFYVEAGVSSSVEARVPQIVGAGGRMEVNLEMDVSRLEFKLGKKFGVSRRAKTKTGSVSVPANSVVEVSYVGTEASYDVPFSYTQQDTSYVDGSVSESEQVDGIFTGTNSYDFNFVVTKVHPPGYKLARYSYTQD